MGGGFFFESDIGKGFLLFRLGGKGGFLGGGKGGRGKSEIGTYVVSDFLICRPQGCFFIFFFFFSFLASQPSRFSFKASNLMGVGKEGSFVGWLGTFFWIFFSSFHSFNFFFDVPFFLFSCEGGKWADLTHTPSRGVSCQDFIHEEEN